MQQINGRLKIVSFRILMLNLSLIFEYTRNMKKRIFEIYFPDSDLPRFAEEIQNVTVSKGRDALLACIVDNLRTYKVRNKTVAFCFNKYFVYFSMKFEKYGASFLQ